MNWRLVIVAVLSFSNFVFAQTEEKVSDFNMISFTYKHDKNWSAYLELQERAIEKFSKPDYYEIKGGMGYNFNKNNQAFVGIGRYGTYKNNQFSQEELRLWLQYTFSHTISKIKIDHRLRAEKRFFYFPLKDAKDNTERFRYRLAATMPLNKEKIEAGAYFINAFEEIFVGPQEPTFKRSRSFVGAGYQFNPYIGTNIGYMFQKEFATTGNRNLHFLYLSFNFTFDRLKFNETHPVPVAD
ncbi:MAG: DUF2490 domain-containing protein [Bacteroidetes bacterium]|nr:DUF2490 domain-containing protein [Bacteroidota bacterium]